jgi:hypothetical protein
MDMQNDRHLFYLAREGFLAPLPPNFRPCRPLGATETYYFDNESRELQREHPCDIHYKKEFLRVKRIERSKRLGGKQRGELARRSCIYTLSSDRPQTIL